MLTAKPISSNLLEDYVSFAQLFEGFDAFVAKVKVKGQGQGQGQGQG